MKENNNPTGATITASTEQITDLEVLIRKVVFEALLDAVNQLEQNGSITINKGKK